MLRSLTPGLGVREKIISGVLVHSWLIYIEVLKVFTADAFGHIPPPVFCKGCIGKQVIQ
jgi:hypothetical protein